MSDRSEVQLGEVERVQTNGNHKVVTTSFGKFAGKEIIIAGSV